MPNALRKHLLQPVPRARGRVMQGESGRREGGQDITTDRDHFRAVWLFVGGEKACVGLSALWGSMEVFHKGTVRCNTCTRKFYSDFAWFVLQKRAFPGYARPTYPTHPPPPASELARSAVTE